MKLTSRQLKSLMKCVSKDETKYNLLHIHYNHKFKRLEATNGNIMTTVPLDLSKYGATSFLFKPNSFFECDIYQYIKVLSVDLEKKEITFELCDADDEVIMKLSYPVVEAEYVGIERARPDDSFFDYTIRFNTSLLPKGRYKFEMSKEDPNHTVKATCMDSGQVYYFMPLRV